MRLRESGMPDEAYWETLFDIPVILKRLGLGPETGDVVELGCGHGTFTLPVAGKISGILRSFDIDQAMVERTRQRASKAGLGNLFVEMRDVAVEGFGVPDASQDACLLFNILHCDQPKSLIEEAARVLRPGGRLLIIHWRPDPTTPRGPSMDIRPRPEQIAAWTAETMAFEAPGPAIDLPPWHYGLSFSRTCNH